MQSSARRSVLSREELSRAELTNVESSAIEALVRHLADLGVDRAFGVSGGSIARLYDALAQSPITLHHFRHETGAAFAAAESYFASGKPAAVFSTTGPGVLNALTGLTASKWDGAKIVFVSGSTNAVQRGRWATQETSSFTVPQDTLYAAGQLFDFAIRMEDPAEFPEIARRLWLGINRPGGYIAHVSVPIALQARRVRRPRFEARAQSLFPSVSATEIAEIGELLKEGPFAIWVGFGARDAAEQIRLLAERSGATVFSSPKGKGVMPEKHPQFIGVTGLGGHKSVTDFMKREKPRWVLVLGSRLSEPTSFWDPDMRPAEGFIHIDIDPEVPGVAYPESYTVGVQADIGQFVQTLLESFPQPEQASSPVELSRWMGGPEMPEPDETRAQVRPQVLMRAIQKHLIDSTDTVLMAECGNSFAWCNHYLRFPSPGRYRVSTLFGSMGHSAAGVVGAALARNGKAVAVLGDGSMLMNSEISTAAQYKAQAVWIVLNDAGYGMCRDGQRTLGLETAELDCPRVDFVAFAKALGADGLRVTNEADLDDVMAQAIAAEGPFVLDVQIDSTESSPLLKRFESLIRQGSQKSISGWEK